jgi:membrane peptidoglycan carboxypeptidase
VLTGIMEQVVERGTATQARIDGFTVAGKTGTAQKIVEGKYSRSDYNASFVGYVPSRKPVFAIVVVIDSPHGKNLYYGGTVAAPIFQRIAAAGLRLYGVPPSINPAPPVLVTRNDRLEQPASGPTRPPAIVTLQNRVPAHDSLFPDLRGLGARDAVQAVARLGLTARLRGAGVVVEQAPLPGTPIERGSTSILTLDRAPVAAAGGGS